jgi:hypothetical protein
VTFFCGMRILLGMLETAALALLTLLTKVETTRIRVLTRADVAWPSLASLIMYT